MNEYCLLVFALVAIYLFECHCSASERLVAFRFRRKLQSQLASPIATLNSFRINVFRSNFLPGFGEIGFCEHVPKLSPEGLCTCEVGRDTHSFYYPLTTQAVISVEGCLVFANEYLIYESASGSAARELADLVSRIKTLSHESRMEEIRKYYRKRLDASAAKRRYCRLNRVVNRLNLDAWFITIVMFGFLPATLLLLGARASLPIVVLTLLLCARQIVLFYRIHRAFYRAHEDRQARRSRLWALALSPPATIRIRDILTRELLSCFDPLAVARAAFSEPKAREFTERTLRRLSFPAEFEKSNCPVAAWAREQFRQEVRAWAQREYGDAGILLRPPNRSSHFVVSYCPRCLQEFQNQRTECPDCPGVALKGFGESD